MTPEQAGLAERLRYLLAEEPTTSDRRMFGQLVLMVNDKILVGAGKAGDLLVRVPADRHEELLERAGAAQAEMGAGRTMGPGWIVVEAPGLESDEQLSFWVEVALDHNRAARR